MTPTFRPARAEDLDAVHTLYRAGSQNPFSVWDEEYPSLQEARHDLETGNLFVLEESGQIIGAVSIVPEREMDDLPLWTTNDGTQAEIARITIASHQQGKGLAGWMVNHVLTVLKARGCHAVRLSAATRNIPAWKAYQKLGFQILGEADLFGSHYYLMEKWI